MSAALRWLLAGLSFVPMAAGAGMRPVTLGLVAPPNEWDAPGLLRGVQLAVAEANETAGGPVRLEVRSEQGQWGTVGNDAVVLVCTRRVDGLIAPSDGAASHLILQVAGRTRVPVACVCSDASVTEAGVPWAVRVAPRNDQEAAALFAAARRPDRPALRWWAVIPADRPGRPVRRDLEAAARSTATPLDRFVEDGEAKTDIASLARTILAAVPDGVLLWLPPARAGAFAATLRSAGYGGRLAGPAVLDSPDFLAAAGAAADGVLAAEYQTDSGGAPAELFGGRFRRKFGRDPDAGAAAAYDAAQVLIETLRRAGNGAGYRQFPPAFPIAGATGVMHFDQTGSRTDALQVMICRQGRFEPAAPTEKQP